MTFLLLFFFSSILALITVSPAAAIEWRLVPYTSSYSGWFSSSGGYKYGQLVFQESGGQPWKAVCDSSVVGSSGSSIIGQTEGDVMCRYLGWEYDASSSRFRASANSIKMRSPVVFPFGADNLTCVTNASTLAAAPTPTNFNSNSGCTLNMTTSCPNDRAVFLSCSGSRSGGSVGAFAGEGKYMRVVSPLAATTTTTQESSSSSSSTDAAIDGVIEIRPSHSTGWQSVCFDSTNLGSLADYTAASLCRVMSFGSSYDHKTYYSSLVYDGAGVAAVGYTELTCESNHQGLDAGNCSLTVGSSCSSSSSSRAALKCVEGESPRESLDLSILIVIIVAAIIGGIIVIGLFVAGVIGCIALCCAAGRAAAGAAPVPGMMAVQQPQGGVVMGDVQMQPVQGTVVYPTQPMYGGQHQQQQQQWGQPPPLYREPQQDGDDWAASRGQGEEIMAP